MPDDNAGAFAEAPRTGTSKRTAEPRGRAYVVSCPSAFRDKVTELADRRGVSAGDLARAVLLLMPRDAVTAAPDPGEPAADDRETVELRSGASKGRKLRRKPRLQLRLPAGYEAGELRRALSLALCLAEGERTIALETEDDRARRSAASEQGERQEEELDSLRRTIDEIALQPLENGVTSRGEALHVLGFSPYSMPERDAIRARYRRLARVYHPDAPFGDHVRMSLLNQALERLIPF